MKKILLLSSLAGLLLTACKGRDKSKPELILTAPSDSMEVLAGSTLDVTAQVSDDQELAQVKVDIHNAYDGHGHVKISYAPFSAIRVEDLAGTEDQKTISIAIPDTAGAGPYHCLVQAVDAAGNLSEFQLRTFIIRNPDDEIAPALNVTAPAEGFTSALGSTFTVSGDASDNAALQKLDYSVTRAGSDNKLSQGTEALTGTSDSFSFDIATTGTAWTKGSYTLRLVLYDAVYNVDVKVITVNLN
ncbi:MAG: DUF4625 domain-containing protein [Flavobacteriales bacterium]